VSTATRRALYGSMAGDTTLAALLAAPGAGYQHAIYYQSAPADAAFPLVIFSKQSGVPTEAFHDPTALDTEVWLVKAIDHSPTANAAEAISERVRALLNDLTLSLAGGATHLYLRRQSDIDYQEMASGETYVHCGSLFRLVYDP
jgi:hypothetical protein